MYVCVYIRYHSKLYIQTPGSELKRGHHRSLRRPLCLKSTRGRSQMSHWPLCPAGNTHYPPCAVRSQGRDMLQMVKHIPAIFTSYLLEHCIALVITFASHRYNLRYLLNRLAMKEGIDSWVGGASSVCAARDVHIRRANMLIATLTSDAFVVNYRNCTHGYLSIIFPPPQKNK